MTQENMESSTGGCTVDVRNEQQREEEMSPFSNMFGDRSDERAVFAHGHEKCSLEFEDLKIGNQICLNGARKRISRLVDEEEDDDTIFFDIQEFSRRPSAESRTSQDDCLNNSSWPVLFEQSSQPEVSPRTRYNFQVGIINTLESGIVSDHDKECENTIQPFRKHD
jgi:hypothetical protein